MNPFIQLENGKIKDNIEHCLWFMSMYGMRNDICNQHEGDIRKTDKHNGPGNEAGAARNVLMRYVHIAHYNLK